MNRNEILKLGGMLHLMTDEGRAKFKEDYRATVADLAQFDWNIANDVGATIRRMTRKRDPIQAKWDLRKTTRTKRALAKKLLKQQPEIEI